MAETIWKFRLREAGGNSYVAEMHDEAVVLSAGFDAEGFIVWAIVDPKGQLAKRFFHIAGTGHEFPWNLRAAPLLNRVEVRTPSALLIFHVFDTGTWDTRPVSPQDRVDF